MIASAAPRRAERCGQSLATALARIAAGALRRRVLGHTHAAVRLGRRRISIEADLRTATGLHLYRHGWCDPAADAIERLVGSGAVVVDGGANIGLFTLVAASVVGPSGSVHAVEAAPATAQMLRRNVARNPGLRIAVSEVALAEEEGELAFVALEPGSGSSSFAPAEHGTTTTVRATTLDTLTAKMARVDLVKLDLEGAELRALHGARRLLAMERPALVMELEPGHLARQRASVEELEALLDAAGYRAFAIEAASGGAIAFSPLPRPWRKRAGRPDIVLLPTEREPPAVAADRAVARHRAAGGARAR